MLAAILLPVLPTVANGPTLRPVFLRTEAQIDPIGIGTGQPNLSWKLEGTPGARNLRQTGYRILVASSPENLKPGRANLWDSGPVSSSETVDVRYQGKSLASRTLAYWTVRVTDQAGKASTWSKPARFSVGLLKSADWSSQWIGWDEPRTKLEVTDALEGAVWIWPKGSKTAQFEKSFNIGAIPARASITLTADDRFILEVNGRQVKRSDSGKDAWRRPVTLNLKPHLKTGQNRIQITAENEEGPAGVIAAVQLGSDKIVTDASWMVNPAGALESSPYGAQPWGKIGARGQILPPPRYLRKAFALRKPVKSAVLHGTALGLAEFHINGQAVSDEFFTPGWTDYTKRVYARTYDVTRLLKRGDNAIGAILGDGWFSGYVGYGGRRDHYGKNLRLKAQLEVTFTDGSRQVIGSDESWRARTGPIKFSDFLAGESYDARNEIPNWSKPGTSERNWNKVVTGAEFKTNIEPFPGQPVRAFAERQFQKITEPKPGVYVLDLGQNLAGFARLKLAGKPGQTVTLRFAERLNPDGTIYVTNLRGARAIDTYTFRSNNVETWHPRFTFHGFQYIEVTGLDRRPKPSEVVGVAVSSDTPTVGTLATSDPMLNKLVSNAWWTQRANFIDVPTDCPQRDERLGWTGDAQAYIRTAAMLTDVQPFFEKWIISLDDSQRADGQYPMVAPLKVAEGDGGPAWADAGVICPWTIYEVYGDRRQLARHYPNMKRFVEFCRKRSTAELLPPAQFHCFGDWLSINANTPNDVIYSAYFAGSTQILAKAARVLGKREDAEMYEALASKIRASFQKAYVSTDGKVKGETQCGYVLALAFDLLDSRRAKLAADHLVADIEKRGGHLSTGFVGTRDIMHVLSKIGRNDVAFKLLHNETFPSWGFTIKNGATSIWERWDGWTPEKGFQDPSMNSFAHYAFGAVVGWMMAQPGGIDTLEPGFKKIRIAPQVDPNLLWSKASYDSVRGKIVSNWARKGNMVRVTAIVPPNVTAEIHLPDGTKKTVGSGTYEYTVQMQP